MFDRRVSNKLGACTMFATIVLAACVTGSAVILDSTPRRAVDPDTIEILLELPDRPYKPIALLEADDQGWDMPLAALGKSLRNMAAKLGADAVILGQESESTSSAYIVPVGTSWVAGTTERNKLKAQAIVYTGETTVVEAPDPSASVSDRVTSGSGILLDPAGTVLTNAHVVDECESITVANQGYAWIPATAIAVDKANDLALLRTGILPGRASAIFRLEPAPRVGEPVIALGFPYAGILADTNVIAGPGNVSALAGIGGDSRYLQVTTPVQPGSSGGPLVDYSGNVVGVVVSKLDALTVLELTGSLPENVNFALTATVVAGFLRANGVHFEWSPHREVLTPEDAVDRGRRFTLAVECTTRR